MPFIGKTPETGAFRLIDSITTSATDTYALTVLGDHYFPESARNLIVSLNGVTQAPETAYTVSGSHIVFASALTSSDVIDYILVIGDAVDIGTPSDGTVGNAQLKASLDLSGKTLTFSNDQISGDVIHGGTISNFASTGIDDNATSTAITIDANEQIGVGTIVPDAIFHTAKTQASGDVPIIVENSGTSGVATASVVFAGSGGGGAEKARIQAAVYGDGYMTFHTNDDSEKMRLDASGNLGIGINSLVNPLQVSVTSNTASKTSGSAFDGGAVRLDGGLGGADSEVAILGGANDGLSAGIGFARENASDWGTQIRFYTHDTAITTTDELTERMRLDASGNLGVGTPSPADKVHVEGGNLRVGADDNTNHSARVILNSGGASGYEAAVDFKYEGNTESRAKIHVNSSLAGLIFSTIQSGSITEDMRLDGAGRLLIGKDAVNNSTAGYMFEAGSTGYAAFTNTGTASSHRVILCNRQSGDGSLIDLQRAGSLKGTIGINSGDEPYFARSVGTTSGIKIANGALYPCQSDGTNHDAAQNLGLSTVRWGNLYLSGGAYIGGTGSANYLDDYEEGNWYPTIVGNNGATGQTYSVQVGLYVKIGNTVNIAFDVGLSNAGTLNGSYVVLGGLPFSTAGSNVGGGIYVTYLAGVSSSVNKPIGAYIQSGLCYLMETGAEADYMQVAEGKHGNSMRMIGWGQLMI